MVRPIGALAVPSLLVLIVVLPSVLAVNCSSVETGEVLVPTGTEGPPPFNWPQVANGVQSYHISGMGTFANTGFILRPLDNEVEIGDCTSDPADCISLPDFNVCWYANDGGFGSRIACDTGGGRESGEVPTNADFALVYMRFGPVLGIDDVGTPFEILLGCT